MKDFRRILAKLRVLRFQLTKMKDFRRKFLENFLRNLLLDEKHELHNREMHISGKFLLGHDDPINGLTSDPINDPINDPTSDLIDDAVNEPTSDPINDAVNEPTSDLTNDAVNGPVKLDGREQQLIELLREEPTLTRAGMAARLGCSDSTVKRTLQNLVDKGAVKRMGSKKKGEWIILY